MRCRVSALAAGFALVAAGCGQVAPPTAGESLHWSATHMAGMKTVAIGRKPVRAAMPFPAGVPADAGTPSYVFVSEPAHWPAHQSAVILQYNRSSPYGVLRVMEQKMPPGVVGQSFIKELGSVCKDCTDNRLLAVTPAIQGALMAGPPATSVTFLVGPYQVVVIGPAVTLTTAQAVAVAGEVARGLAAHRAASHP